MCRIRREYQLLQGECRLLKEHVFHCGIGKIFRGDSKSVHAHCLCDVCGGKAVARSTEYHHGVATRELKESHKAEEHVETAMGDYFNEEDPSSSTNSTDRVFPY